MDIVKKTLARFDGWANILTGIGNKFRDKKMGAQVHWAPMTENECDELFAGSDLARTICEDLPKEAFREGYEFKHKDVEQNDELKKLITDEIDRLRLNARVLEATIKARQNGGAGLIAIPENVLELEVPLNLNAIRSIRSLLVLTKFELTVERLDEDIRSSNFGQPLFYRVSPRGTSVGAGLVVHHTHVIRFDGVELPRSLYQRNNYWHDSVLNSTKDAIRDYDASVSAVATALTDASVPVYKIKGLADMVAQGDDELVTRRMTIIDMVRSVARAVVIDSDTEDFMYQDRTFSGVNEAVTRVGNRLVAASKMPHTRMLGESPTGSNATGNSTTVQWYDTVAAWQTNYLKDRLIRIWDIILSQRVGPTGGRIPVGYEFEFAPLWQPTETERATTRKLNAESDVMYIQNGVLEPEAVTRSRMGTDGYANDIVVEDLPEERTRAIESEVRALPAAASETTAPTNVTTPGVDETKKQETALSSAQVQSLTDVIKAATTGELTKSSALEVIMFAFQVPRDTAERMLSGGK